jgi:hypothetical protein
MLIDDFIFAFEHDTCVELYAFGDDAVGGEFMRDALVVFRRLQQGFGRNTTDIEACTSETGFAVALPFVDTRDFET